MIRGTTASLRTNSEDLKVVDNSCLLKSTKDISSQEICHKLALGRLTKKTLQKMF